MVAVKSVKIDGELIHLFNSALYVFTSTTGSTLQLDILVSEVVLRRYQQEDSLIVEIELEDGRIISCIMYLKVLPGGLPQLNLFCDLEDTDEYADLLQVNENDNNFPNIEEGITLEDIRKVEMPNEKVTLKLTLPIDQVEWLKQHKPRELNQIFHQLVAEYRKRLETVKEEEQKICSIKSET